MSARPKDPAKLTAPLAELAERLRLTPEQIDAAGSDGPSRGTHAEWAASRAQEAANYPAMLGCGGQMIEEAAPGYPFVVMVCDECGHSVALRGKSADSTLAAACGIPLSLARRELEPTPENAAARGALRAWLMGAPAIPAPSLYGPVGVAKSVLLAQTALVLARRGLRPVYRTLRRLCDEREAQWRDGHESAWERAGSATVLLLDDIGAEQSTEARKGWLTELLQARLERELPLLASTNFAPTQWPLILGDRAASRLCGLTDPVLIDDEDWRAKRPQEAEHTDKPDAANGAHDAKEPQ